LLRASLFGFSQVGFLACLYIHEQEEVGPMGVFDNAKETIGEAAKQAGRAVEDAVDKVKDKADEMTADAKVKKAEAERDAVKARNEAKDEMRD